MKDITDYVYSCGFSQLEQKRGPKWNFRCPICGDSTRSKTKKRGWIFVNKGTNDWQYYCHNCHASMLFSTFLKENRPEIYDIFINSYRKKELFNKGSYKEEEKIKSDEKIKIRLKKINLPTIYSLNRINPAYEEFEKRQIPKKFYKYFYYCDAFKEWINSILPNKFEDLTYDEPKIIIPFYTRKREVFAVAGRSLNPNAKIRYVTIKFDESHPKIFGLERINTKKHIYVFEGQFDSIFIPNSLAFGGADLSYKILDKISDRENFTFCYDIEPRNKQIIKKIFKTIEEGYSVCLFPKYYRSNGKDINDLIISGLTSKQILNIINDNTFRGTNAFIKLNLWKEIKL